MAWLSGWSYRKEITITGQSGAGTNYQVTLDIGDSAGGDFHLEGHCTNFPQDIEVTDNDGTTLLKFWIEDLTVDPLKIWVKVADDLGSNQTIYVYYGKSGATTNSDGAATFLTFDDFEDALQGDWTTEGGTPDYDNTDRAYSGSQSLKMGGATPRAQISMAQTAGSGYNIQYQIYKETAPTIYPILHGNGTKAIYTKIDGNESIFYYDTAWSDTGTNITPDDWERLEVRNIDFTAGTYDIYLNDSIIQAAAGMYTLGSYQNIVWLEGSASSGQDFWIDNFIIRKFSATQPAFSSAGNEETSPAGAPPTAVFYGPLVGPLGGPI